MAAKKSVHIPFEVLPEGRKWSPGHSYRVKTVLKQTGTDENGAMFEIVDATSLEPANKGQRYFLSDGGILKG